MENTKLSKEMKSQLASRDRLNEIIPELKHTLTQMQEEIDRKKKDRAERIKFVEDEANYTDDEEEITNSVSPSAYNVLN